MKMTNEINEYLEPYRETLARLLVYSGRMGYLEKFELMMNLTPIEEQYELVNNELKNLQNKLLNCNDEFFDAIQNATRRTRDWIDDTIDTDINDCDSTQYTYVEEGIEININTWEIEFLSDYIQKNGDSILDEILSLNIDLDTELPQNINSEVEKHPVILRYLDYIDLISFFSYLFRLRIDMKRVIGGDKLFHIKNANNQLSGLNSGQTSKLFESLVNGQFIPANTDPDSFKWIFGATDQLRPERFKPVSWNEAKQGLRELLTPILGTITNQHIRDIQQLFTKDGKPLVMSKPKKDEHSARCTDIEKIVKALNL